MLSNQLDILRGERQALLNQDMPNNRIDLQTRLQHMDSENFRLEKKIEEKNGGPVEIESPKTRAPGGSIQYDDIVSEDLGEYSVATPRANCKDELSTVSIKQLETELFSLDVTEGRLKLQQQSLTNSNHINEIKKEIGVKKIK